jgi:hypothetical protein
MSRKSVTASARPRRPEPHQRRQHPHHEHQRHHQQITRTSSATTPAATTSSATITGANDVHRLASNFRSMPGALTRVLPDASACVLRR